MGFLDDLDSAFETLLDHDSQKEEPKPTEATGSDMDPLKAAIADEQARVIRALLAQLAAFKRKIFLPALAANLERFLTLETGTTRAENLQAGHHLLHTRQGQLRKRLTAAQKTQLDALAEQLPAPSSTESEQARMLLQGFERMAAVSSDQVFQFYAAGIWRADQIQAEHLGQLVDVTGWPLPHLEQLQQGLAAR